MKKIVKDKTSEIIINKSRFICHLVKVNDLNEVDTKINDIKKQYKDATHYCYAYIIDNTKRFSDDGEPGGTAGMPILNVLEKKELNHVLAIVIRFFGGIKLGAGGLVRAYTNSITNTIEDDNIIEEKKGLLIELKFNYDVSKQIDNILKNVNIINKEFNDIITYKIEIENDTFKDLEELLNKIADINIIKEILI